MRNLVPVPLGVALGVRKSLAARRIGVFLCALCTTLVVGATVAEEPAEARSVTFDLDIPAQSLGDALQALALASQHKLLYTSELVDGRSSPALKGQFTTEQAVKALLSGTNLSYEVTSDGLVLIRAAANPAASMSLKPLGPPIHLAQVGTGAPSDAASPQAKDSEAQQAAADQPAAGAADSSLEVTVTGTRIRGVSQVGSTLMTLDQAVIQESGLTNTNDILDTNPAILNLASGPHTTGGTGVASGGGIFNTADIHGLGAQATLNLVNGHRTWSQGLSGFAFDANSIPAQMLSRVEVVPDGTSPIYGADAVAGTVNYVLRKPADVAETYVNQEWMEGSHNWYATGIFGHAWNQDGSHSGGVILGYQHAVLGALAASTYPGLYNNNFAPYGGSPSADFAAPGNILVGATTYAVPHGQNGQTLTLSQLGAAGSINRENIWAGAPGPDVNPRDVGDNFVLNYYQDITDWLQFFGDSMYSRHTTRGLTVNSSNDVAAKVPNSNPYSPCNPGHYTNGVVTGPAALLAACATGSLTVNYNDLTQVGPGQAWALNKGWETSNGFHIKLPGEWQVTPQVSLSQYLNYNAQVSLTNPNPGTFNYFCDPTSNSCAQPGAVAAVVPPYEGTALAGPNLFTGRFYQLQGDGPLFTIPGGKVRLATGVEYDYWEVEEHTSTNIDPTREDRAGYLELFVPVVGRDNALPGIQSLELDIAGRIDNYTDTGRTTNPKLGINWTPFAGLKFHGSYGKSFHSPLLATEGDIGPTWRTSTVAASAISPALCPQCTSPALYGIDGATKLVYAQAEGANPHLSPETSTSFSAGLDWAPESLPGLTAGFNWWWIKYINQVGTPENRAGPSGAINSQLYNDHVIYNPTFFPQLAPNNPLAYYVTTPLANLKDPNCAAVSGKRVTTQALYNQYLACTNDNSGHQVVTGTTSPDPNDVIAYTYYGNVNAGTTLASGFDLNAAYLWQTTWGNWKTVFTGEYIPRFDVAVIQGSPVINEAGHFGYALKFKGRLQFNYQRNFSFGALSPSLFVNYNSSYTQDRAYLPVGVPASYADINAHATLDATLVYSTGTTFDSWLGRNITLSLSSQNVLNQRPPLVLNNTIQFDPGYGWPPARVITLQVGKSW